MHLKILVYVFTNSFVQPKRFYQVWPKGKTNFCQTLFKVRGVLGVRAIRVGVYQGGKGGSGAAQVWGALAWWGLECHKWHNKCVGQFGQNCGHTWFSPVASLPPPPHFLGSALSLTTHHPGNVIFFVHTNTLVPTFGVSAGRPLQVPQWGFRGSGVRRRASGRPAHPLPSKYGTQDPRPKAPPGGGGGGRG